MDLSALIAESFADTFVALTVRPLICHSVNDLFMVLNGEFVWSVFTLLLSKLNQIRLFVPKKQLCLSKVL